MAMARDHFKLCHPLFLVFAWQCCAKVGATFHDVTGVIDLGLNHRFSFRAFGSHGIRIPNNGGSVASSVDMQSPTEAPGIAPVGLQTPLSKGNKALSFDLEIGKSSIASLGLEIPKSKGGIVFSLGHEMSRKGADNIVVSRGGKISLKSSGRVVSNEGKIGLKSRGNDVSHGLRATKSSRNIVVSHGLKTIKRGDNLVVSHGLRHGLKITKSGDNIVLLHGLKTTKSDNNLVVSHSIGRPRA